MNNLLDTLKTHERDYIKLLVNKNEPTTPAMYILIQIYSQYRVLKGKNG